jgi:bifunctional non-homologous end joining protein LigD
MLATPGKLSSARGWIYELKHDGFRCLITKRRKTVRLESRSGRDMGAGFPELVEEIQPIRADSWPTACNLLTLALAFMR